MSRRPSLPLLSPVATGVAAQRILDNPTYAVQRVALDEVYSLAVAYLQLAEISGIVSRRIAGRSLPEDDRALRGHMVSLGCLPASFLRQPQEPPRVD